MMKNDKISFSKDDISFFKDDLYFIRVAVAIEKSLYWPTSDIEEIIRTTLLGADINDYKIEYVSSEV